MSHTVTHHFFFERVDFRRVRKEDLEKNIFSTVGVAKWVLGVRIKVNSNPKVSLFSILQNQELKVEG